MRKAGYLLGLAFLVVGFLCVLPTLQAANEPVPDSPEVTELLMKAKAHALQLRDDADLMHKFSLMSLSWESHASQITTIKDHVNNLGKVLEQMNDRHKLSSPWQQAAIDRVTPLARELASNIETTIDHINKNQNRLHTPQYKEYLTANFEVSSSLSELISDYVEYGKYKANYEKLEERLEVAD